MNHLPVGSFAWRIVILLLEASRFLYAPMLMATSFVNSSKLVTVWAGWSLVWQMCAMTR